MLNTFYLNILIKAIYKYIYIHINSVFTQYLQTQLLYTYITVNH